VPDHGAQQARVVHTAVLEEPVVFGGQHCVDHLAGNGLERQRNASLFSELGDKSPISAEHPQGHLQANVLDRRDIGQAGPQILVSTHQPEQHGSEAAEQRGNGQPKR
jgi:hypothetical protein